MQEEFDIKELITKFLAGEVTTKELDLLNKLLGESEENRRLFDKENELWNEYGVNTKLQYYKTDEAWNVISSKLAIGEGKSKSVVIINKHKIRLLLAAASVAIAVAVGSLTLLLLAKQPVAEVLVATTMVMTDEGQKAHIFMPDSTEVFMNSGSSLKYDAGYNTNNRTVTLSGEAFFDVRTNPDKPFIVQAGQVTVTATGTRFNVLSYCNENRIETTLEEGSINVTAEGKDPIFVEQGQQVVYYQRTNKTALMNVNTETYTSWKENKLRLIDTPFEEALRRIGRRYNVVFEVRNTDLLDLKYTATFIDESIEEVMQLLKSVSPISYEIHMRTSVNDKQYLKPKIIIRKRKV